MLLKVLLFYCTYFLSNVITQYHNVKVPTDHGVCKNWTDSLIIQPNMTGYCKSSDKSYICFSKIPKLKNKTKNIEELVLCGYPNSSFDARFILKSFKKIKVLRIEHSNMTYMYNDFPEMEYLESINISWTHLEQTRPTLFENLKSLKYLDLRWNKLDHMDLPLKLPDTFESLNLTGNPWNCTKNIKWLLDEENNCTLVVTDRNNLTCHDQNFGGKHLLTVMQFKVNLRDDCRKINIKNCTCTMSYVRLHEDRKTLIPMNTVYCNNLHLTEMPTYLPMNTTTLHMENNRITDLNILTTDFYKQNQLQDIYLDYNLINSIDILENGVWLERFRVFSLKGNKLTRLPIYALNNALKKNHNVVKINLSHNPWRCDCVFIPKFQQFIMEHEALIKDSNNVTCKYIEGDDLFGKKILDLKVGDVCKVPNDYKINPLDLLNGVLGTLIIFVLSKLGYDYYHYRRYGQLPWIVTKMP